MRTTGLIGGMSWESTMPYYRQINEPVKAQLGGLHSARIILYSVDFHAIFRLQHDRDLVHRIIYDELCLGTIAPASRAHYRRIMADLVAQGAQAIILGCTEITLLVGPHDAAVPVFDTTHLHARTAALHALGMHEETQ